MITTPDATTELAAFLRASRRQLDPAGSGPPSGRKRRTPGLRREDLAERAGVSVDYIVRLEQARGLRPSERVAAALADALELSPVERSYLFDLARPRPSAAVGEPSSPPMDRLVADLSPLPAMLMNHRFDILAWNTEMADLLVDFDALPASARNAMRLCLLDEGIRARYEDPDRVLRDGVALIRTAWAKHPGDAALLGLVEELIDRDADFARLWREGPLDVRARGRKVLRHPDARRLELDFEVLVPLENPDQQLLVFHPVDAPAPVPVPLAS